VLRNSREVAARVGLSAALLVLGVAVAVALPPGFVAGGATTLAYVPPGSLLLSVSMNNGSGAYTAVAGSQVRLSQTLPHGVTILAQTNESGEVEITVASGQYAVSVFDQRFSYETILPVNPGKVTQTHVLVNRTSLFAFWVEAQDSSTTGQVETWNQVEVGVSTLQANFFTSPIAQFRNYSNFAFPTNVFLQPIKIRFNGVAYEPSGPEIPATVISQVRSSGLIWLVLRPLAPLSLSGANYLGVVAYNAGGNVTIPGA